MEGVRLVSPPFSAAVWEGCKEGPQAVQLSTRIGSASVRPKPAFGCLLMVCNWTRLGRVVVFGTSSARGTVTAPFIHFIFLSSAIVHSDQKQGWCLFC